MTKQSEITVSDRAFFGDPDGNTPELSFGQQNGLEIIIALVSRSVVN